MRDGDILPPRFESFLEPWGSGISLRYGIQTVGEGLMLAQPLEMKKHHISEVAPPFMTIGLAEAQMLMDSLWHCGIRPTEGAGSAGAFAAQGKHLEDMRKLVFEGRV